MRADFANDEAAIGCVDMIEKMVSYGNITALKALLCSKGPREREKSRKAGDNGVSQQVHRSW